MHIKDNVLKKKIRTKTKPYWHTITWQRASADAHQSRTEDGITTSDERKIKACGLWCRNYVIDIAHCPCPFRSLFWVLYCSRLVTFADTMLWVRVSLFWKTLRTFITYTLTQTAHPYRNIYLTTTSSCHVNGKYGFVELNKKTRNAYTEWHTEHTRIGAYYESTPEGFGNMPGI